MMRTTSFAAVVLASLLSSAHAQPTPNPHPSQPATTEPSPYPPPPPDPSPYPPPPPLPQPQPQPGYGVPPPHQYVPVALSAEEQRLLADGEISDGQHVGGALVNIFIGFGLGQAVQGRWSDTGWIFTLGSAASMTVMFIGFGQAVDGAIDDTRDADDGVALTFAGALAFTVFHVWGIVDAFAGPPRHNRRVRELRMRLGMPVPLYSRVTPYVNTTRDGGGVAGLTLRF